MVVFIVYLAIALVFIKSYLNSVGVCDAADNDFASGADACGLKVVLHGIVVCVKVGDWYMFFVYTN